MPNPKDPHSEAWSEHRFISFDKTVIYYRRYLSLKPLRASVLILHGMGEHGGRYLELAGALCQSGVQAIIPDLRGFGQSGGKRGCLRRFEDYFRDLDVVARLTLQREPDAPLFVLGHSFGGLIASSWLATNAESKMRGLILSSPNFGIALHVPLWRRVLAVIASYLAPDYTQDNRVDSAYLTHDTGVLERYKVDRFNHHRISARLYSEMVRQLARKNEIARQLKVPALVLQAGDDRVVSREDTRDFFNSLASKNKELEIFEGLYHEILNETGRGDIYTKISSWITNRL